MKTFMLLLSLCFAAFTTSAQTDTTSKKPDPNKKLETVKVACGQCKLGLSGHGCDLALRINGKAYFIDGTTIDDHGDAHANDGFCKAVREAKVQGEVVGDRFKVTYFELLPEKKKKK
jgi:hypothetical protein